MMRRTKIKTTYIYVKITKEKNLAEYGISLSNWKSWKCKQQKKYNIK